MFILRSPTEFWILDLDFGCHRLNNALQDLLFFFLFGIQLLRFFFPEPVNHTYIEFPVHDWIFVSEPFLEFVAQIFARFEKIIIHFENPFCFSLEAIKFLRKHKSHTATVFIFTLFMSIIYNWNNKVLQIYYLLIQKYLMKQMNP